MTTALDTQPTKAKPRRVTQLGKLLAAHNEILSAWIMSGLDGHVEIRRTDIRNFYAIEYCGHESIGFKSLTIYQGDHNFEAKKQIILDYLSGKSDCLEEKDELL